MDAITGAITMVTKQSLSILLFIILAIIGWKILKRGLHIVVLIAIAVAIMWYLGWLF